MNQKSEIRAKYEEYISQLEETRAVIRRIEAENKKFEAIRTSVLSDLEQLLDYSRKQMKTVMEGTVWDKLVIAFFGVTNAGKSTIIETFRVLFKDRERERLMKENGGAGVDGLIVGSGILDFTKVSHEYNLKINDKPFVLIDVPGIEGKEEDYWDEILKALKQAHCVFFVHGENKPIEAPIVEKIKKYLSDWVEVYSIYNIRTSPRDFDEEDERTELMISKYREVEDSVFSVFSDTLGELYKGHISLHAFMALSAVASFHESQTIPCSNQRKYLDYFGSEALLMDFSRFQNLVSLVDEKAGSFSSIISRANWLKLDGLKKRIERDMSACIEENAAKLDSLIKQLTVFRRDVKTIFTDFNLHLKRDFSVEADEAMDGILEAAYDIIGSKGKAKEKKAKLKGVINHVMDELKKNLKTITRTSLKRLKESIVSKRKDLDESINLTGYSSGDFKIDLPLDLDSVFKDLDFNFFKDGLLKALGAFLKADAIITGCAAVGGAIGSGGGPPGILLGAKIGAGVGAALSLVSAAFRKEDDPVARAKEKVREEIEKKKEDFHREIEKADSSVKQKLEAPKQRLMRSIQNEIKNVGTVKSQMSELLKRIKEQ